MNIEQRGRDESSERLYPNVSVLIHFVHHRTAADAEGIDKFLEDADMYLPEFPAAAPNFVKDYQRMANGDYNAYARVKAEEKDEPFFTAVSSVVFKRSRSRKKLQIAVVDVPLTYEWIDKMPKLQKLSREFRVLSSVEDTLKAFYEREKTIVDIQRKRNGVIVENFTSLVKRVSEDATKSKQKEPTRLLMIIGGAHQPLLAGLQERGINAQSTQNSALLALRTDDVIGDKLMKGEVVDRRLLLRAVAENIMESHIRSIYTPKKDTLMSAVSEKMDNNDLEKFIESVIQNKEKVKEIGSSKLEQLTGLSFIDDETIDLALEEILASSSQMSEAEVDREG